MIKLKLSLVLLIGVATQGYTQNESSEIATVRKPKISQYPKFRPLIVQYQQYGSSDFKTDFEGNKFREGESKLEHDLKVFASMPFLIKNKWILSATVNYEYFEFQTNDVKSIVQPSAGNTNNEYSAHDASFTLSAMYRDSLFQKPLIFTNSLIFDSKNFYSIERLRFMSSVSLIMKRNEHTTITAGLAFFIDRTIQIPVFPLFSYSHQFGSSPWSMDLLLPSRMYFRRECSSISWLSTGVELNGSSYFFNNKNKTYSSTFEHRLSTIEASIIYEYRLNNWLMAGVKGGVSQLISSRVSEKGAKSTDYIFNSQSKTTPFVNFSLSFAPIMR